MKTRIFAIFLFVTIIATCRDRPPAAGPAPDCPATPCFAARASFYFWKTKAPLPAPEDLARFGVDRLYLRLFDVDLDASGRPVPVAPRSRVPSAYRVPITPVVYLTVRSLRTVQPAELGRRIVDLVRALHPSTTALQLDCDWTDSTRAAYFALINEIKKEANWSLSATIRLHQLTYHRRTGVPPVDRGVLMFYNMGDPRDPAESNSILNLKTAEAYLKNFDAATYPLRLDLALPYFSWGVVFVHGAFFKLLPGLTENDLRAAGRPVSPERFILGTERVLAGVRLPAGAEIRLENVRVCDLNAALVRLRTALPADSERTLILFDYDSSKMNRPDMVDFLSSASGPCSRAQHSYFYRRIPRDRPGPAALFVRAGPAVSFYPGRNCRRARKSLAPVRADFIRGG